MMATRMILAVGLIIALGGMTAQATIIDGAVTGGNSGGSFIELSPGFTESDPDNTVGDDNFDDPNLYAFNEDQNILLPSNLDIDIHADGSSTSLPAGATVASHYVVFDPVSSTTVEGYVDFDSDIVAIITSTGKLSDSDFLANTGVNYENPGLRGLEGADSISIDSVNAKRVNVDFSAGSPGDVVRVLTNFSPAAIPAPGVAAAGLGMFALLALRRRR